MFNFLVWLLRNKQHSRQTKTKSRIKITHCSGFGYKTLWSRLCFSSRQLRWCGTPPLQAVPVAFFQKAALPKHTRGRISSLSTTVIYVVCACTWLLRLPTSRKQQLSTKCWKDCPACAKQLHLEGQSYPRRTCLGRETEQGFPISLGNLISVLPWLYKAINSEHKSSSDVVLESIRIYRWSQVLVLTTKETGELAWPTRKCELQARGAPGDGWTRWS